MSAVSSPHGHDEDSSENEFFFHSVVKGVESLQHDASSSWYSYVNEEAEYTMFGDIPNVHIVAGDMLLAAKTEAEHDNTPRKVMERARGRCVKFNMKKTQMKKSDVF